MRFYEHGRESQELPYVQENSFITTRCMKLLTSIKNIRIPARCQQYQRVPPCRVPSGWLTVFRITGCCCPANPVVSVDSWPVKSTSRIEIGLSCAAHAVTRNCSGRIITLPSPVACALSVGTSPSAHTAYPAASRAGRITASPRNSAVSSSTDGCRRHKACRHG